MSTVRDIDWQIPGQFLQYWKILHSLRPGVTLGVARDFYDRHVPVADAAHAIATYGEDESPIALFVAVLETTNASELIHLGRAILARHDSLCDVGYRIGEPHDDPAISALADALGKLAA